MPDWRILAEALCPLQERLLVVASVAQQVIEAFRRAYRDVGAPYGDSDDGLLSWLREESERQASAERAWLVQEYAQTVADVCAALDRPEVM